MSPKQRRSINRNLPSDWLSGLGADYEVGCAIVLDVEVEIGLTSGQKRGRYWLERKSPSFIFIYY